MTTGLDPQDDEYSNGILRPPEKEMALGHKGCLNHATAWGTVPTRWWGLPCPPFRQVRRGRKRTMYGKSVTSIDDISSSKQVADLDL